MRITGSDIAVIIDPLSYASGFDELSGSPLQSFDKSEETYSPSRVLAPYVIVPWVATMDKSNGQQGLSGRQKVTNAVYNISRCINGTYQKTSLPAQTLAGYEVATEAGTISGVTVPQWALVVTANVPNGESVNIECIASFTDPQTGKTSTQTVYTSLTTNTTETASFELKAAAEFVPYKKLSPLRIEKDANGFRRETIAVQLYRNGLAVSDANAAYFWFMVQNGVEVKLSKDNQTFIDNSAFDASNNLGKSLSLKVDYFDNIKLVCRAAYYKTGASKPTVADDPSLVLRFSRTRKLPSSVTGTVLGTEGAKVLTSTKVTRSLQLTSRGGDISDALANENYLVAWNAVKSTGATSVVGGGLSISKTASDLGVTNTVSVALQPDVKERACLKPKRVSSSTEANPKVVVDSQGRVICYSNTVYKNNY